ncbi:MAG: DNA polymerase III subunit gamma/tau [Eubacteriales bacterium]|nr:DNA polymerase III subunit gamma/tau [Eubacteriales bacterium]
MAYQALYRKWRPMTFSDVTGQGHIVDTLKNEIISGKIAHAYLFCGTRGTGKTSLAKIFARAVNCLNLLPNGDPCNQCEVCRGIIDGTIMDVNEIDAASNNGVDNIRDIRNEVVYQPSVARYRVYIIDEVHMLSTAAFNALLKTLEEPPAHVIFILATTESHKVPATIRSRCQRFDFRRISQEDISERIKLIAQTDGISITPEAISKIAYLADGSMRDSLSILEQCIPIGNVTLESVEEIVGIAGDGALLTIAEAINKGDISEVIGMVDTLLTEGKEVIRLMESILDVMRNLIVCKSSKDPKDVLDLSAERLERYIDVSKRFTAEELMYCIRVMTDALTSAKLASKPKILLETALLRSCNPDLSVDNDAVLARVARLEKSGVTVHSSPVVTNTPSKSEIDKFEDDTFPVTEEAPPPMDMDAPPWENDIAPQVESAKEVVKEEPKVEVMAQKPKSKATSKPLESPVGTSADELLDKIGTASPVLKPSLIGAQGKVSGDTLVILQAKSFTYGMLCKSIELMEKTVNMKVSVVNTDEEYNSFSASDSAPAPSDGLGELLAQKDIFGDKMIIE